MAYSNTRYTRYRHSPKLITPIQPTPKIQDIETIQTTDAIQPIYPYRGLDEKRRAYERARQDKQTQTFLANYNDPTELNSYIDALTNREAVSKKFGDVWGTVSTISGTVAVLSFAGSIIAAALAPLTGGASAAVSGALAKAGATLAKVGAVAAIPAIPAAIDVTIEKSIKPILAGKPKEAALNTLMNLGETADFIANPVKGLFIEGPEGFVKGTGLAEGGRVNYDYDTGFFLTDMLLETISDPLNWVTLGTTVGLKSATTTIAKETTQQIVDKAVTTVNKTLAKSFGEITTEGAERISKQITKTTAQVSRDWAMKSFDKLTDAAKQRLLRDGRNKIQQSLVRAIRKELPNTTASEINIILRKAGKETAKQQVTNYFMKEISDITFDTLSTNVIKSLSGMQYYSDAFQKFMTKGAMMTSGYGLGVEAAKNGWKGIKAWANNFTLNKLKRATVFDNLKGLDIKQYAKAKGIWEASYKYTSELTGEITQRDMNSFYVFMHQQFNRDKQLISQIMQEGTDPLKKAGRIADQIQNIYGCDFKEYIGYIKGINDAENGVYSNYIKYLESVNNTLNNQALAKPMGAAIKMGKSLFNANELEAQNIILDIQNAIKTSKDKIELTDKFYTIKMNNAYVNAKLMNDPQIAMVLSEISSDEQIGALLNKISEDLNALKPEIAAQIPIAARTVKEAGASFMNIHRFYDEIAALPLEKIKGISDSDLKKYIIDQVFNDNKTVSELLAEFDSITMPSLKNGLETMLYAEGFKFANYPSLEDQIAGVYRRFLEAQQAANIERVGATIVENFTKSIDYLIEYMPQYADELKPLTIANKQIKGILAETKAINLDLLENIFTDKATIFGIINTRQLTDAGLALKTVAIKENLDMFDLPGDLSGNVIAEVNRLGASLKYMENALKQYSNTFVGDAKRIKGIEDAYKAFRVKYIENPNFTEAGAFKYLKRTTDTIEQYAQLIEFNKIITDKITKEDFKWTLKEFLSTKDYLNLLDPANLMVTDFAWDAMAQSAWIAEKQFNEMIINGITAYRNLGLNTAKITNDFQAVRDLLSMNKLDRPKMLQQERYIKAAAKFNDLFEFLEQHYNSRFNKTLAEEELNSVRNVLINFPELNKRYSDLVDKLEAYWNGELKFQQSPKYEKGQENFIDEFTPFWEEIKVMNQDIQQVLKQHNDGLSKAEQIHYKNITPWDPVKEQQELNKLINKATDANAKGAFYNLFNLTPEEFKNELAYRKRYITFNETDIADSQLKAMFNKFNKSLPEGVKIIHDKQRHRYWYVLDKSQKVNMFGRQVYLNDNPIMRLQKKKSFDEFKIVDNYINDPNNPGLAKTLNELEDSLETLTGSRLGDSQGEYLSKEAMQKIYDQMPEEVKKLLPEFDEWTDKQFFNAYVFNESVLGSAKSKRELGMFSSNQIINTRDAITGALGYLKPKNEYVNSVFDSQLSISSPNSVWTNFSDNDLLEALQTNPEYKLVVLVDDKKYGMKTREILPTSVDAIKKAKELGGWIIPTQTYKDMYNVVNHRLGSTGFAKLWSRIMYAYKFGYLVKPGAWIRNWIDTNLKSRLEMGTEYSSYQAQAHKILNDVDSMKKYIQSRDPQGLVKSEAIKQWFAEGNAKYLTYEQYFELDRDFLSQGISGNIMADLYKTEGGDLWNTFTELTGNIVEAGNKTENYNRLAMYLYELDHGLDYTSALSKLAKTHFDYSFKTKAEQLADMIFPFTTFSMRNYSYWIEMIEKHPWIMRNYIHLMKPHWDFKDYTPEELARDYRVQNQILNGQLKLGEFNNKVITFKANPSIQDAIQMFSDPINNVYEKLAAPLAYPINTARGEYTNELNLIPIVGPAIQASQQMFKTGSPLPSAIGVQPTPRRTGNVNFKNKNLTNVNKYTDNTYRTPKYRNNIVYDSYSVKGIKQYRVNLYPVVDIAHEIRSRYTVNVANRIKNRIRTNVYNGIRYRIKLDVNRFR